MRLGSSIYLLPAAEFYAYPAWLSDALASGKKPLCSLNLSQRPKPTFVGQCLLAGQQQRSQVRSSRQEQQVTLVSGQQNRSCKKLSLLLGPVCACLLWGRSCWGLTAVLPLSAAAAATSAAWRLLADTGISRTCRPDRLVATASTALFCSD